MPNWVYSNLKISGPENEIDAIESIGMDFEKILPTPDDLMVEKLSEIQRIANVKKYGHESWYEWRCANWETKWTASDLKIKRVNSKILKVSMNTPWSLPLKVLKKLSADYPNTTICIVDCEEESGAFVGSVEWLNGKMIKDELHKPTKDELETRGYPNQENEKEIDTFRAGLKMKGQVE